jgi:hypothetical protein
LPCNLQGALKHLLAQRAAVFSALIAVDVLTQRVDEAIFIATEANVGVDYLLVVLGTEGFIVGGQVGVLESPPTADIQHQHEVEVIARPHPLHHLVESGSAFGVQAALAAVGKLVNDFDVVLLGERDDVVLLYLN